MQNVKTNLLIAALAFAGIAQVAQAVPVFPSVPGLYIYDTATATGVSVASVAGIATYAGTVGDYFVSITGSTGSGPTMNLGVAVATALTGATTLQVFYSDGAFGLTGGNYSLYTTGPLGGPMSTSAYLDTTIFGQTTSLGGSVDTFPYTVNATGTLPSGSYYLTLVDTISGSVVSGNSSFSLVPDGGATVMLLGIALSGLGLLRKKLSA